MRTIWIVVVVSCSMLCGLADSAFSQEPEQFESLLASAQQAQAKGDFEAAAGFYRKAVAVHPEIAELRANLGLMYFQTGKDEPAISSFLQAIHLKPSLFVPNLFLGLDYVRLKRFNDAIPYLKRAAFLNAPNIQAQLALGQAYTGIGKTRPATDSYLRVVRLDPKNADGWFHLGVSYLEQVEADSRILLAQHKNSAFVQRLVADNLAEQGALIEAADAYKKALTLPTFPAGTHASYGFVLLNQHDVQGAERELKAELGSNPGSLVAKLGLARSHIELGAATDGAKGIEDIWKTDAGFLRANVQLFNSGLAESKRSELRRILDEREADGDISQEVVSLFYSGATAETTPDMSRGSSLDAGNRSQGSRVAAGSAAQLYLSGRYTECRELLASRLQLLPAKDLRLLASCAYSTGKFRNAFDASQKLASNAPTEAEGLYWGIRSAQKLATNALARASEIDSGSPYLHVLLGDVYRQRKLYPDAEEEYRKALALRPEDTGALLGLSLALIADSQTDEALHLTEAASKKNPDDPELNAVMGEILSKQYDFSAAEPYLKKALLEKALNTRPELAPHVHALLGRVYAETNRTREAINELNMGLADDEDGHIHYQLARLYLKIGDRASAKKALEDSKRLQSKGETNATVSMQPGENDTSSQ